MRVLEHLSLSVPGDVSVAGFDDVKYAEPAAGPADDGSPALRRTWRDGRPGDGRAPEESAHARPGRAAEFQPDRPGIDQRRPNVCLSGLSRSSSTPPVGCSARSGRSGSQVFRGCGRLAPPAVPNGGGVLPTTPSLWPCTSARWQRSRATHPLARERDLLPLDTRKKPQLLSFRQSKGAQWRRKERSRQGTLDMPAL